MKVIAPGKVLFTGAYAVIEGAPAIVIAVDRYAKADSTARIASPSAEIRAAFGSELAPKVDSMPLYESGTKIGLGSSAAALAAALGADAASRGEDLLNRATRDRLFEQARAAHAAGQKGGSGVDIAASIYGGVNRYQVAKDGTANIEPFALPESLVFSVYWSGVSARTVDLRAAVDALRSQSSVVWNAIFRDLSGESFAACDALAAGDVPKFILAATRFEMALAKLGDAANAPIVPPSFRALNAIAQRESAVFFPSGAGGGDIGIFLGTRCESVTFKEEAKHLDMRRIPLHIDSLGVRVVSSRSPSAKVN